jgi:hypothetical protein
MNHFPRVRARARKKSLAAAVKVTTATAVMKKLAPRKVSSLQLYICEYRVTKMISSGYKQYKTHQIDFNLTGIQLLYSKNITNIFMFSIL